MTTASGGSSFAERTAYAAACDDSRAGMMPSVRQSRSKAATASSSLTVTYLARPVCAR